MTKAEEKKISKPLATNGAPIPPVAKAAVPAPPAAAGVPHLPASQAILAATLPPNIKQQKTKANKAKEASIAMRKLLWPEVTDEQLWLLDNRTTVGFAQIPRTMPILMNMISDVSKRHTGKAVPAGRTYLVLWCRVYGEALVKVDSEATFAYEAGYSGERNVTTWREHIRVLKELGFIDYREGPAGPMQYVLLFNPYTVIKDLHAKGLIPRTQYIAFFQRTSEIGASSELAV